MATVTGGRVVSVSGKRDKFEAVAGMDMNISMKDVAADKDQMTVTYEFAVKYNEGVGNITITGLVYLKEEAKRAAQVAKDWQKMKDKGETPALPDDVAEIVMNSIVHAGAVMGTFVAQPLGLSPPMMLMPVRVGKGPVLEPDEKAA